MAKPVPNAVDINELPLAPTDPAEVEVGRDDVALLTRTLLLTANPDMAIVRIFGSDKAGDAVRIGLSPERAMRLGAAFIRAALRLKPQLRAQVVDSSGVSELQALIGEKT